MLGTLRIARADPVTVRIAAKTFSSGEASSSDKIPIATNSGTIAAITP